MSLDCLLPTQNSTIALISSDELLLLRDYLDKTRLAFREAGFEDIQTHYIEPGFDWEAQSASSNMSLFSILSLTIYYFFSAKPGIVGARAIAELCEKANPEDVILLVMPKLDASAKKSAWLKKVQKAGQFVELKPIYSNQLVGWLEQRAQFKQFSISHDAARFLADRTEGNLLAADQELEKLTLLFDGNEELSLDQVAESVANQSRFSNFELADCCLRGDSRKAVKVLLSQQAEGVANLALLGTLKNYIEQLAQVIGVLGNPQALQQVWRQTRIWDTKQNLYINAAKRLGPIRIEKLLAQCALIDRKEKGQEVHPIAHAKLKPISADIEDQEMLKLIHDFSGMTK